MSKVTFLSDNHILTSGLSLVAGTVNAQFPLDNIKHDFTTKVFRSTGASCSILIDLLSSQEVDMIAINGSSIDGLGFTSATIEGSASPVFAGTPVSLNISQLNGFAFKELSTQTLRYWRLVLTGVSYIEISNIFIGKKVQMMDNSLSLGFSYSSRTNSQVSKNAIGQRFTDSYGSTKLITGEVKYANSTEFDQLNDIHVAHGENTPIWFMLDPQGDMGINSSEYLFSGMFYMKDLEWKNVAPGLWDVAIALEEAK
jgi:hypothetical protein